MDCRSLQGLGFGAASLLVCWSCSGQKQAADPRDILGPELRFQSEQTPNAAAQPPPDEKRLATAEECRAAAENMVRLEKRLAAARGTSVSNPNRLIEELTQRCLDLPTTQREALCIAELDDEKDVESCVE